MENHVVNLDKNNEITEALDTNDCNSWINN